MNLEHFIAGLFVVALPWVFGKSWKGVLIGALIAIGLVWALPVYLAVAGLYCESGVSEGCGAAVGVAFLLSVFSFSATVAILISAGIALAIKLSKHRNPNKPAGGAKLINPRSEQGS